MLLTYNAIRHLTLKEVEFWIALDWKHRLEVSVAEEFPSRSGCGLVEPETEHEKQRGTGKRSFGFVSKSLFDQRQAIAGLLATGVPASFRFIFFRRLGGHVPSSRSPPESELSERRARTEK